MQTIKVYKVYIKLENYNDELEFEFNEDYEARNFLHLCYTQGKKAFMQIEDKEVFKGE